MPDFITKLKMAMEQQPRVLQSERDELRAVKPFEPANELHDALMQAFADDPAMVPTSPDDDFIVSESVVYQAWQSFKLDIFETIENEIGGCKAHIDELMVSYKSAEEHLKTIIRDEVEEKRARARKYETYREFATQFQECFENLLELEQQGDNVEASLEAVVDSIRDAFPDALFGRTARTNALGMGETQRQRSILLLKQRDHIAALERELESVSQSEHADIQELEDARSTIKELTDQNAALEAAHALTRHLEADENTVKDAVARTEKAEKAAEEASRRAERAEKALDSELEEINRERSAYADLGKSMVAAEAQLEALEADLERVTAERDALSDLKARMDKLQSQSGGPTDADAQARIAALEAKLAALHKVLHEKESHIEHLTIERNTLAKLPQFIELGEMVSENNHLLRQLSDSMAQGANPFASSSGTLVKPMKEEEQLAARATAPADDEVYDFFDEELPATAAPPAAATFIKRQGGTHVYTEDIKKSVVKKAFSRADKTAMVETRPEQTEESEPAANVVPGSRGLLLKPKTDRGGEPNKRAQDAGDAVKPFTSSWDG